MIVTAAELIEVELGAADRARFAGRANQIVTVEWFGRRIAARFEQAQAAAIYRARYIEFLVSGPAELESCAAFAENGEPLFWTEPGAAYRYPAPIAAAHVVAFLADAVTQRAFFDVNAELLSFHAAAVAVGNRAAAISAISTGGKSTTAIACARRGMPLFSDERCVLKDGRVNAFPRTMNLRQHGVQLLVGEEVPADGGIGERLRAHGAANWESISMAQLLGARPLPVSRPLAAIFFVDGKAASPEVMPLGTAEAITRVMGAGFGGPPAGLQRVAAASALVRSAQVFTLVLGSPDATAQLIGDTVRLSSLARVAGS